MKKLLIASTAACGLAIAAVPAIAQMDGAEAEAYRMTDAQEKQFMDWSAEKRIAYQQWPIDAQEYYWSLTDNQKEVWWNNLNDEQRVRIVRMAPEQRAATWESINTQLGNTSATTARSSNTGTSNRGTTRINYVSNTVVQPTPNDEGPPPPNPPICEPMEQDNCINAEAVGPGYRPST